jgi:hypothetical protein
LRADDAIGYTVFDASVESDTDIKGLLRNHANITTSNCNP